MSRQLELTFDEKQSIFDILNKRHLDWNINVLSISISEMNEDPDAETYEIKPTLYIQVN